MKDSDKINWSGAEWIWILDLDFVGFCKKYENIKKIWIWFGFDLDFRVFHQILLLYGFDLLFEKHIWIWICPNPSFLSNPEHWSLYLFIVPYDHRWSSITQSRNNHNNLFLKNDDGLQINESRLLINFKVIILYKQTSWPI